MKTSVTTILSIILSLSILSAQDDHVIFGAMKEEMERSLSQLKMDNPNTPPILFISYTLADTRAIHTTASNGTVIQTAVNQIERVGSVRLTVGDNTFSSDHSYTGNGLLGANYVTFEPQPAQIRAAFWTNTDIAYKLAIEAYNSKLSNIKNANLTDEEKALKEYIPMHPCEHFVPYNSINLDRAPYEYLAVTLSSSMVKENSVVLSSVALSGVETVYYTLTSEGVKSKQAVQYIDVTLKAKVRLPSGQVVSDEKSMIFPYSHTLPDLDLLLSEVKTFSAHLAAIRNTEKVQEYYLGPVLFENEAVAKIFSDNLLSLSGLLASRKPIQVITTVARAENIAEQSRAKSLEERLGKKVLDSRISVFNVTDMDQFNDSPLLGAYKADAQGVIPKPSITLIQNGILKSLLTHNVPTLKCNESTGSLRFGAKARSVTQELAPGLLFIEAPNGESATQLKAALLACAREEGLDYGYIVRKFGGSDLFLFRVSVADGSETLVTNGELQPVPLAKLKRVMGVAKTQYIQNFLYKGAIPCAVICPSGLLIEDIEINIKRPNIQKDSELIKN